MWSVTGEVFGEGEGACKISVTHHKKNLNLFILKVREPDFQSTGVT